MTVTYFDALILFRIHPFSTQGIDISARLVDSENLQNIHIWMPNQF